MLDNTTFITDEQILSSVLDRLQGQNLAMDTEFIRTSTYRPILALLQFSTGKEHFLVDPLAVQDLSALDQWMQDDANGVIFHACGEDMEIFEDLFGRLPKNLYDTQIAATLAGIGHGMGYQRLMKAVLDVDIDKDASRSDWLARPLTQAQLRYAVIDVAHLNQLHELLQSKLEQRGRWEWYRQECALFLDSERYHVDPTQAYLRFKSLYRLPPRSLTALQQLCQWREETAQRKNIARNRVCKDQVIYQLAERFPTHKNQIEGLKGSDFRSVKRYAHHWLEILDSVQQLPEASLMEPVEAISKKTPEFRALRERLEKHCRANDIPEEIICNSNTLATIAMHPEHWQTKVNAPFTPWRIALINKIVNEN